MPANLVTRYVKITRDLKKELGERSLVLMQVGSFYEVYALRDKKGNLEGGDIEEFCKINRTRIASKGEMRDGRTILMAGFGLAQVDPYTTRLVEAGYTVAIYDQDASTSNPSRDCTKILSPGTFVSEEDIRSSNTVMCVWVRRCGGGILKNALRIVSGAALDVHTGHTNMFQAHVEDRHDPVAYDELERQIAVFQPRECIIIHNLGEAGGDLAGFMGYQGGKLHLIDEADGSSLAKRAANAAKQTYQDETLAKYYSHPERIMDDAEREYDLALQAFVFLLDFAHLHNPGLTERLSTPKLDTNPERLLLGNHSLLQLNIISDSRHEGRLSSVVRLLDQTITPMGSREFTRLLVNPTTDAELLQDRYTATDAVLQANIWQHYRKALNGVMDVQKLERRLVLRRLRPKDLVSLESSAAAIATTTAIATKNNSGDIDIPRSVMDSTGVHDACCQIREFITSTFNVERLAEIDSMQPDDLAKHPAMDLAISAPGACPEIDELIAQCTDNHSKLQAIADAFSTLIQQTEKKKGTGQFVRIHETAKSPPCLASTSRRLHNLSSTLKKKATLCIPFGEGEDQSFDLPVTDLEYTKQCNSRHIVTSPFIRALASGSQETNEKLIARVRNFWTKAMIGLSNLSHELKRIGEFSSEVDVLQARAYIAKKYNYCSPVVVKTAEHAFFDAKGLRHPLIEHLSERELYVTNDMALGQEKRGMLLYGTNAVGKTSLIRAVGIAIVMAQAGLHVPCQSLEFSPYHAVYTRILGTDNIFKGLSTFAVEMAELRAILKGADKNSLILGDELCSGTESGSAIGIFAAGLESLHDRESTFLFATHLHEVNQFSEVKKLDGLSIKHLQVLYDAERDVLIYDRKLKDGPGEAKYGLEVCKSLGLPEAFLERAHGLRKKYSSSGESVLDKPSSRYNAKKVRGMCQSCKKSPATQVHHLQHQARARSDNAYIGDFHKDHTANLLSVCEECHHKFHEEDVEHRFAKTSEGYQLIPE